MKPVAPISLFEQKPLPQIQHIALGVFDGFHLGHQAVIAELLRHAGSGEKTAAVTFEPHPLTIIAPEKAPARLTTAAQREELLINAGVDVTLTLLFDSHLRELSARDFLGHIHRIFPNLKTICVGPRWSFGKNRGGDTAFLRKESATLRYTVVEPPAVLLEGGIVSSTRVREAILHKKFSLARALLGRPYAISGVVSPGSKRGSGLGFPTANLSQVGQLLPPEGVYAAHATLPDGQQRIAAVNIGKRPTFGEKTVALEAHLLDWSGDLYGQSLALADFHFLRDEKKFDFVEALKAQIQKDVTATRASFQAPGSVLQ
jgi:riboflavin kinase/FMN adenylyltransferase